MTFRQKELLGATALLLLIAVYSYLTTKIDMSFASDLEKLTGPRTYPRIILAIMGFFCVIILVQAWMSPREPAQKFNARQFIPVCLALALVVVFTALFEPIGYLLTVPPLVFLTALLNRAKSRKSAIAVAILAPLILLVIFRYGLNTVLPEGILGIDGVF